MDFKEFDKIARVYFKKTIEKDDVPKGEQ